MMDAKLSGRSYDQAAYGKRIRNAVAEMVRNQVQCGIDIVTDGEQSKPSFNAYLIERLTGFEAVASSAERIAARMGLRGWVKRFALAERPGAYLRVVTPGLLRAGDAVDVTSGPRDVPTIREVFAAYYRR